MAAPTFVADYEEVYSSTTTPGTVSVTVANGDVLVVIGGTEDFSYLLSTPTGGGLTYTLQQSIAVNNYCTAYAWTAPSSSGQTYTQSVARSGSGGWFGYNAVRFSGSAGVGASAKTNVVAGAPTLNITTTAADSAIVVIVTDWTATDGTSRTWRTVNGLTPTAGNGQELTYFRDGSHYAAYVAYYPDAGVAGSKTVGLSAPAGQKYSVIAVEVLGTAGGSTVNGAAAMSAEGTLTANPTVVTPDTGTLTGAGTVTAAGTIRVTATASLAGAGTLTASSGGTTTAGAALAAAATLTAGAQVRVPGSATLTAAGTFTATGVVRQLAAATLTGVGALTGSSGAASNGTASMTGAGSVTAAALVAVPGAASLAGIGLLTAAGSVRVLATAALAGSGSLTPAGVGIIRSTAVLTGVGSVTATAAVPGLVVVRPNMGTTARPSTGTITRPDTGIVIHVLTVVVRLYTGTISRP